MGRPAMLEPVQRRSGERWRRPPLYLFQFKSLMGNGVGMVVSAVVVAALLPALAGCVLTDPGGGAPQADWERHAVSRPGYDYTIEYPAGWTVEEEAVATRFAPPGATAPTEGITVVVFDPAETPPPPVHYTYTAVRVIDAEGQPIPVVRRDPGPATEAYLVLLEEGRYTAEIRFALDRAHDAVFDHMVRSFSLSPKPR